MLRTAHTRFRDPVDLVGRADIWLDVGSARPRADVAHDAAAILAEVPAP